MVSYSVEVLLDPSFTNGQADPEMVSDAGLVAATSDQGGTPSYVGINFRQAAFLGTAPRNSDSIYLSVNNRGHSVGIRGFHAATFKAVWSDGSTLTDLAVPSWSAAVDINDFEEVVGWNESDARGFLLDRRSGTLIRIPPPPGMSFSAPEAINASGDVVGDSDTGGFVFSAGASRSLPIRPADLNNQGLAAGAVFTGATSYAPALCDTRQSSPTASLQPVPAGFVNALFYGVNDAGLAVGQAWGANLPNSIAFVCERGVSTDLNTLVVTPGWNLISAKGINNAGQIVGLGWINQRLMGYIASPVRERGPFELVTNLEIIGAILLGGVAVDGGGYVIVGGKPRPVGPWGPLQAVSQEKADTLLVLALDEAARRINDPKTRANVRNALLKAAAATTKAIGKKATKAQQSSAPPLGRSAELRQKLQRRRRKR